MNMLRIVHPGGASAGVEVAAANAMEPVSWRWSALGYVLGTVLGAGASHLLLHRGGFL